MTEPTERGAFWQGVRDGLPFLIVIIPFGMLFGVLAREAGWDLSAILAMCTLVIAGASQFTALQLMHETAPTLVVIGTALAVNLRLALYSASLAPHLGPLPLWQRALAAWLLTDQSFGASVNRFSLEPGMTPSARLSFYFGVSVPVCLPWLLATWVGAVAGSAIPDGLALDFAVPITFIALVAPALRDLAHVAAAMVAVVASLLLAGLPYSGGLLIAAGLGMVTGSLVEWWRA
jgi:4-azaleucine resistance transporter AzlC